MVITAKMTSKNQITIPKAVRDRLGIKNSNATLKFDISGKNIVLDTVKDKDDFWNNVFQQEKIYGNLSTPEIDWGEDVGSEIID